MHAPHTRFRSLFPYPNPHRQRVDEQPHHTVRPLPSLHPPEQHRPKHHILTPTHSCQHLRPRHMTHTRRTHPQLPRSFPYSSPQSGIQQNPRFLYPRPIPLHIQQPKRRRRLFYIPQHPTEKYFVLLPTHTQPRLRHQVPERSWHRQPFGLSQQMRLRLLLHHFQRAMISRQMMQQLHHQPPTLLLILRNVQPQQRRLPYIHPVSPRVESRVQLFSGIPRSPIQLHFFHA